jgi:hypothetical protein
MKKITAVLLSTALLHSLCIFATGDEQKTKTKRTTSTTQVSVEPTAIQVSQEQPPIAIAPTTGAESAKSEGQPVIQPATQTTPAMVATQKKEDKQEVAVIVESEPSWISRLSERFYDSTTLALWIMRELEKGKKESLIHKTHQVDRSILDSVLKEQQTIKENTQPNPIDRLQAIQRKNLTHQNNLKTIFEGSAKHKLQLNDTALNNAFELCNTVKSQEVEYLKAVADEAKKRLELTQQIQAFIVQLKQKQDKEIPATEYANIHTVLNEIKALQ